MTGSLACTFGWPLQRQVGTKASNNFVCTACIFFGLATTEKIGTKANTIFVVLVRDIFWLFVVLCLWCSQRWPFCDAFLRRAVACDSSSSLLLYYCWFFILLFLFNCIMMSLKEAALPGEAIHEQLLHASVPFCFCLFVDCTHWAGGGGNLLKPCVIPFKNTSLEDILLCIGSTVAHRWRKDGPVKSFVEHNADVGQFFQGRKKDMSEGSAIENVKKEVKALETQLQSWKVWKHRRRRWRVCKL